MGVLGLPGGMEGLLETQSSVEAKTQEGSQVERGRPDGRGRREGRPQLGWGGAAGVISRSDIPKYVGVNTRSTAAWKRLTDLFTAFGGVSRRCEEVRETLPGCCGPAYHQRRL